MNGAIHLVSMPTHTDAAGRHRIPAERYTMKYLFNTKPFDVDAKASKLRRQIVPLGTPVRTDPETGRWITVNILDVMPDDTGITLQCERVNRTVPGTTRSENCSERYTLRRNADGSVYRV